jgi:hypothetical protein
MYPLVRLQEEPLLEALLQLFRCQCAVFQRLQLQ